MQPLGSSPQQQVVGYPLRQWHCPSGRKLTGFPVSGRRCKCEFWKSPELSTGAPSCLPTHLKSPVVAPHLGAVSGLPSTFNRRLVEGHPLLQGSLQPWAGGCGFRLW